MVYASEARHELRLAGFDGLRSAARLDRLPISGFHRDIVKLLAYIFFFELGDLNSFAFAAPGVRQAVAAVDRHDQLHYVGLVRRHVHRRDDGRVVFRSRGPETRARADHRVVFGDSRC